MLDNLALTTNAVPDVERLKLLGGFNEDKHRRQTYKYCYSNGGITVFIEPHKFSDSTNARISFAKIIVSPKQFRCFADAFASVLSLFPEYYLTEDDFSVTRFDIAADMHLITVDALISSLVVKNLRKNALRIIESTIYAGKNPMYRIYDKKAEIQARLRKGCEITDYERELLKLDAPVVRFEIQVRPEKMTLRRFLNIVEDQQVLFDKLQMFGFGSEVQTGVLHRLWPYINRKFRQELLAYQTTDLIRCIKATYVQGVRAWRQRKEPF